MRRLARPVPAGVHRLALDASALGAGVYVARAEVAGAEPRTFVVRLTMVK